jgi:hypothetical protein
VTEHVVLDREAGGHLEIRLDRRVRSTRPRRFGSVVINRSGGGG